MPVVIVKCLKWWILHYSILYVCVWFGLLVIYNHFKHCSAKSCTSWPTKLKHILIVKYYKLGSDTSLSNLRSLLPIIIKDDSPDSYTELTVETTRLCCLRSSMTNNKWKYKVLISNSCSVLYGYRGLVPFFVVEYIVVFNWTRFLPLLVPRRMAPVVASLAFCQFHPTESMWWPCNVLIIISKFPI